MRPVMTRDADITAIMLYALVLTLLTLAYFQVPA
jgi:hypothetical protein